MLARRFLGCIFVLTLLFVAAGVSIYQWGDRFLIRQAIPKGHFEAGAAGSGPDYTRPSAWITGAASDGDPTQWRPVGEPAGTTGNAAVFYIHPTTYLNTDTWNAPIEAGGETEVRTQLFAKSQASAFNGVAARIWAPRYRQAAYGAFLLKGEDAQEALDFAYRDVAAAFDEFLKEAPPGSPIILAGHSQGALHLERLLREKIAGKLIAKRIVAAYVVGWPISTTSDLQSLGLPACSGPAQTGCILSWMTFADPPNPEFIFSEWEKSSGFNGGKRRREDTLCVNPLNGTQNGAARAQDNPGTLLPTADMRDATLQPGIVGAHCHEGLLIVDGLPPQLGSFVLPGNNYHVYDYALFWGAIRRDAERRLAAWHG